MTISIGDRIPNVELFVMGVDGPTAISSDDLFGGKKVALFGLPGTFTRTCSAKHLPGFVNNADALNAKGVAEIVCLSVNDAWVMNAWGESQNAEGHVAMVGGATRCGALPASSASFGKRLASFAVNSASPVAKNPLSARCRGASIGSSRRAIKGDILLFSVVAKSRMSPLIACAH